MADHRTILATGATLNFLNSQPGEFTATEIRNMGIGFHCDNDDDDVEAICNILASQNFIRCIEHGMYIAFSRNPIINALTHSAASAYKASVFA